MDEGCRVTVALLGIKGVGYCCPAGDEGCRVAVALLGMKGVGLLLPCWG